ncbi:hypothetical protein FKM82_008608 [Ascaphus truei]
MTCISLDVSICVELPSHKIRGLESMKFTTKNDMQNIYLHVLGIVLPLGCHGLPQYYTTEDPIKLLQGLSEGLTILHFQTYCPKG